MTILIIAAAGAVAVACYLAYRHDRRRDAAEQLQEQNELLRANPEAALLPLREQFVTRKADLGRAIDSEGREATAAEARHAKYSEQVWRGKDPQLGFVVIVGVLSVLWVGLFVLQRSTDITVMQALGTVAPQLFGNVIAVVFVILGIIMSGVAGLHHLLPSWLEPRRVLTRVVIVSALALIAIAGITQVADLAQYRSIDRFTAQVNTDQDVLAQLRAKPQTSAVQVQIVSQEGVLAQDRQRLDSAKSMDKTLTMAILPAELLLSCFPIIATELLIVAAFGRAGKRHRKLEQRHRDAQAALPQQLQELAARMLARADPTMTAEDINAVLARLNGSPRGGSTRGPVRGADAPWAVAMPAPPPETPRTPQQTPPPVPPAAPRPPRPGAGYQPPTHAPAPRVGRLGDVRGFGNGAPGQRADTGDDPVRQHPDDDEPPPAWAVA